jgi:hypothetical protein
LEGVLEDLTYALREQKKAAEIHGEAVCGSLPNGRKIQRGGEGSEGGLVSTEPREGDCAGDGEQGEEGEQMSKSNWVDRFCDLLADIEGRKKKAVREGRKMAALGWKFMWVLIFSPIGLLLVWWVVSIDR